MRLKKKKVKNNIFFKELEEFLVEVLPQIIIVLIILMVFFIFTDLYQYLTTELWWTQDSINYKYSTIFLLILIAGFSFLPIKKIYSKWPRFSYLIISLFLIILIAHQKYNKFYDNLQQYPKIKTLSKNWGIPGSWVKITGKNFGAAWQPGKVYLGETEMTIKRWEDKEIIFEIPVNVGKNEQTLKVFNAQNNKQEKYFEYYIKFDLKEASEILK
ncbi:IPT/TIG domain-containing protein [Patescibacteria group bacterium]|nr:IPT/TIG domain-containing protein [Patescibacteria group bacterium]